MPRPPRPRRQHVIKIRVDDIEKSLLSAKAEAAGMTVAAFLRDRIEQMAVVNRADWQHRTLHLSRIGTNLNQLAMWAWTNKSNADAHEVVVALLRMERAIRGEFGLRHPDQDAT